MLNVFTLENGKLTQVEIAERAQLDALAISSVVWVDAEAPSADELSWITARFSLAIPENVFDEDLEESARFFEEDNGELHIRSDFLIDSDAAPLNVRVAFILFNRVLFSVRAADLPVFRLLRLRARRMPGLIENAMDVLLALYATDAEYSADALEGVYDDLESVGQMVLKPGINDEAAASALASIAQEEDLNGRIRRNVMDTRRAISFLMRSRKLNAEQFEDARQIMRDLDSLDGHTAFLFDKINFLMDATVGFININQNKVIKLFSVVSVALMPPTLIASIYGMNFKTWFPELEWAWGYPFSLALMAVSAAIPLLYFRKKGWLGN